MIGIHKKLSSRKWAALSIILLTVIMQSLQYVWYLVIIDPLPNLSRLFSNRFILVASNLIQVSCMGLFSLSALSKHWPVWFGTILAWILFVLSTTSVVVDAAYSGIASIETYVVKEVYWSQFNQTVAITHNETVYQTISIVYFVLQALIYDLAQVAVVSWIYKTQLCWTNKSRRIVTSVTGFNHLSSEDDDEKDATLVMIENAATAQQNNAKLSKSK